MNERLFPQMDFPQEGYDPQKYVRAVEETQHMPLDVGKISISGHSSIETLVPTVKHQKENLMGYGHLNIEGSSFLDNRFYTGYVRDMWLTTGIHQQMLRTYLEKENRPEYIRPTDIVPRRIELEENEIAIVPVRELTYQDAKKEIVDYIKKVGRKVDTVEIVEELWLDIELTMQILEEIESEGDQENG